MARALVFLRAEERSSPGWHRGTRFIFRESNSQTAPYELCLLGTSSNKEAVLAGNDQLPPGERLRPRAGGAEDGRTCPQSTGDYF